MVLVMVMVMLLIAMCMCSEEIPLTSVSEAPSCAKTHIGGWIVRTV